MLDFLFLCLSGQGKLKYSSRDPGTDFQRRTAEPRVRRHHPEARTARTEHREKEGAKGVPPVSAQDFNKRD